MPQPLTAEERRAIERYRGPIRRIPAGVCTTTEFSVWSPRGRQPDRSLRQQYTDMIRRGLTVGEMAHELNVSVRAVRKYMHRNNLRTVDARKVRRS